MKSVKRLLPFILAVFITGLVVWAEVIPMWSSGVKDVRGNLRFNEGATFYDAGVHLSLIGEMQSRFPPTNFAYGGAPLKNYHYFYDAILAITEKVTRVSYLDLYYRYAPVVLAAALSAAVFLTVFVLTKDPWLAAFGIFFTVFGTSLGTLTLRGHNNVFMTDQIYDMMVNPQGVLSLTVFLTLFLLLFLYEVRRQRFFLFTFALLLAVSFGIKAHGGAVFSIGAAAAAFWFAWRKRDFTSAVLIALGLGGMALWVLGNLDKSAVGLKFAPFWLLERLMGDYERLYNSTFVQSIIDARFAGNWFKLGGLYVVVFLVYVAGSLGLRLLGLVPVLRNWRKWNHLSPSLVFLFVSGLVSFLVPLIFNQGKKPFDIVQFTPYFTLLTGIGFTVSLGDITKKLKPLPKVAVFLVFVIAFLVFDRQEIVTRIQNTFDPKPGGVIISQPVVEATDFIRTKTPSDSVFLLAPTDTNLQTLWFTSLSWRRTVYSGEFFPFQVGTDTVVAKNKLEKIFGPDIVEPDFSYIFLRKSEITKFGGVVGKYRLQKIFENSETEVFKRV